MNKTIYKNVPDNKYISEENCNIIEAVMHIGNINQTPCRIACKKS